MTENKHEKENKILGTHKVKFSRSSFALVACLLCTYSHKTSLSEGPLDVVASSRHNIQYSSWALTDLSKFEGWRPRQQESWTPKSVDYNLHRLHVGKTMCLSRLTLLPQQVTLISSKSLPTLATVTTYTQTFSHQQLLIFSHSVPWPNGIRFGVSKPVV